MKGMKLVTNLKLRSMEGPCLTLRAMNLYPVDTLNVEERTTMGNSANIVILDGYTINPGDNPWNPLEALGNCTIYDRTPAELVVERSRHADIILTSKCRLDAEVLHDLSNLKFI